MLVVNRFRVQDEYDTHEIDRCLDELLSLWRQQPGFIHGEYGQCVDDKTRFALSTSWATIRTYRRALGTMESKMAWMPLSMWLENEPSAYELPGNH